MKNYLIFLSVLLLTACNDKQTKSTDQKDSTPQYDVVLTVEEQQQALQDIQSELSFLAKAQPMTKSDFREVEDPIQRLSEVKADKWSVCKYYDFDVESFYASPSPERLLACLSPSTGTIWFVCERSATESSLVIAKQGEQKWQLRTVMEWQNIREWINTKLKESDNGEYKLFNVYAQSFFTYYRDRQPVFCSLGGEEIAGATFCQNVLGLIELVKSYPHRQIDTAERSKIQEQINQLIKKEAEAREKQH